MKKNYIYNKYVSQEGEFVFKKRDENEHSLSVDEVEKLLLKKKEKLLKKYYESISVESNDQLRRDNK